MDRHRYALWTPLLDGAMGSCNMMLPPRGGELTQSSGSLRREGGQLRAGVNHSGVARIWPDMNSRDGRPPGLSFQEASGGRGHLAQGFRERCDSWIPSRIVGLSPATKQFLHRKTEKWWEELGFGLPQNWFPVPNVSLTHYLVLRKLPNHWGLPCSPQRNGVNACPTGLL